MSLRRFTNSTGCALAANHTIGAVHAIPAGTRRVLVYSPTATVWIRFGAVGLVGTDVDTLTESTTATDLFVVAGEPAKEIGCPGSAVKVAFRSAADPGGVVYCIPLVG